MCQSVTIVDAMADSTVYTHLRIKDHQTDNDDLSEPFPQFDHIFSQNIKRICSTKLLFQRIPILKWLPKYQLGHLPEDFVAGITVGLTAIPQSIAYAVVAGLPPQYGLYSAFMGCFVYCIFGSSKDITIGPTAIMALMVQTYVRNLGIDYAVLAAFLSGVLIFVCGLLNLGFLVTFISSPVTAGFTTAAAITIGSGQVKSLLGLSGKSDSFIESWTNVITHIGETRLWDTVLGFSSLALLLLLKRVGQIDCSIKRFLKYLSLARNALIVIGGTCLAYIFYQNGMEPFKLTGEVRAGLPTFQLPPFSTQQVINNQTVTVGFEEMVKNFGSALITLPLIAILESVAIAKAFSKGKTVDATQEMLALGLCNIFGSFFSSMPTTGSFTRSAVNNASGVRTTLGGIFTGSLVLLSLGLLSSTFYFIPKATLAAVIIAAMIAMVEFHEAIGIWKTKRIDIIPFVVTLLVSLWLGLEFGILVGVGINLCLELYKSSKPTLTYHVMEMTPKNQTREQPQQVLVVTPNQSLNFSSAEYFRYKVLKHALNEQVVEYVVVDGSYIHSIDTTVVKNIKTMINEIKSQNQQILFLNWHRDVVKTLLRSNLDYEQYFCNNSSIDDLLKHLQDAR